jgi:hypothetical protein
VRPTYVVWSVYDTIGRFDVAIFIGESDAIDYARSLNVHPVPRYQVERSYAWGGATI